MTRSTALEGSLYYVTVKYNPWHYRVCVNRGSPARPPVFPTYGRYPLARRDRTATATNAMQDKLIACVIGNYIIRNVAILLFRIMLIQPRWRVWHETQHLRRPGGFQSNLGTPRAPAHNPYGRAHRSIGTESSHIIRLIETFSLLAISRLISVIRSDASLARRAYPS